MEITAVEMDGQTVLMQDCPECRGRGAVDLVDNGRKVRGAQCPECHGLRVVPYWVVPNLRAWCRDPH